HQMSSLANVLRLLREAGADHGVAGDELGELVLAPALGAGRSHRQHQKAGLGGGIPHPDLRLLPQPDAQVGEHAARILDRARAVGRRLVPDRRQAQHFPRIAGAQRADDHVVLGGRVLDRDQMIPDPALVAERAHRLRGVLEQRLLQLRIGPGLGDDARAVARRHSGLLGLDDDVERGRSDVALLGEHRLQRAHAQLRLRALRAVLVVVIVVVGHGDLHSFCWHRTIIVRVANEVEGAKLSLMPRHLATIADSIDRLIAAVGRAVMWLALAVVLLQFAVVVLRYAFGLGSIWLSESVLYAHAALFMLAAAWTLQANGHVRVDVFYADASPRAKALVDLLGALLLL